MQVCTKVGKVGKRMPENVFANGSSNESTVPKMEENMLILGKIYCCSLSAELMISEGFKMCYDGWCEDNKYNLNWVLYSSHNGEV